MDTTTSPTFLRANILLVGVAVLGLVAAVFLGLVVGRTEIGILLMLCAAIFGVTFAVQLYKYTWQIAIFLIFFGFAYRPLGFAFGSVELSCAFGVALIALFIWQRKHFSATGILAHPSFTFMRRLLFAWLVYVVLHFLYNYKAPYRPAEFVLSNAVKSYFLLSAPLFLLFYFTNNPAGLRVKADFFRRITQLCFFGLVINVAIRMWEIRENTIYIFIPLLNAIDGYFTLRSIGPMGMLLGAIGITAPRTEGRAHSALYWSVLLLGVLGTILSGGRASLVMGTFSIAAVLFLRGKVPLLTALAIIALVGVAFANAFSDWINTRANEYVQRSLQWVLVEKGSLAEQSIESSSRWRRELARRAFVEWQSSPRIFWFGRATYGFGVADERAMEMYGGFEAMMETALRRGATHNLLTDLLVAYGLVGCLLYLLVHLSVIRFLWHIYRVRKRLTASARNLAIASFVGAVFGLITGIVAGGSLPIDTIWFVVVLVASVHFGSGVATIAEESEPLPIAPARQLVPAFERRERQFARTSGRRRFE